MAYNRPATWRQPRWLSTDAQFAILTIADLVLPQASSLVPQAFHGTFMQYVNLGATGLKVSRICLGCMTYGSKSWRRMGPG